MSAPAGRRCTSDAASFVTDIQSDPLWEPYREIAGAQLVEAVDAALGRPSSTA